MLISALLNLVCKKFMVFSYLYSIHLGILFILKDQSNFLHFFIVKSLNPVMFLKK